MMFPARMFLIDRRSPRRSGALLCGHARRCTQGAPAWPESGEYCGGMDLVVEHEFNASSCNVHFKVSSAGDDGVFLAIGFSSDGYMVNKKSPLNDQNLQTNPHFAIIATHEGESFVSGSKVGGETSCPSEDEEKCPTKSNVNVYDFTGRQDKKYMRLNEASLVRRTGLEE